MGSKLSEELHGQPSYESAIVKIIWAARSSIATVVALFICLTYFLHFNFATGMLRLVYLIFLCMFPLASIIANCVVGNNLGRVVLDGQDKLAVNAEFLEYEDQAEDILRKATVRTVARRISLQKWAMTPLYISGWYKMLGAKDFAMQLYTGYVIELCCFTVPLLVVQIINNAMLDKWDAKAILSLVGMAVSVLFQLRGVVDIGDRAAATNAEKRRASQVRRAELQQRINRARQMGQVISAEDYNLADGGEDSWASTTFSTQRVYR